MQRNILLQSVLFSDNHQNVKGNTEKVMRWNHLHNITKNNTTQLYSQIFENIDCLKEVDEVMLMEFILYLLKNGIYDYSYHQKDRIFEKIIKKGESYFRQNGQVPYDILKTICYQFSNDEIAQKYLTHLCKQCQSELKNGSQYYCLEIVQNLLSTILKFSKGEPQEKSLNIENKTKMRLLQKVQITLQNWILMQKNNFNDDNPLYEFYFLKLCRIATLYCELSNDYVIEFKVSKNKMKEIFLLIQNNQRLSPTFESVETIFGFLNEFLKVNEGQLTDIFLEGWCEFSFDWILKCSKINIFWNNFLKKLDVKNEEYLKQMAVVITKLTKMLCTKLKYPFQDGQIYFQKLKVAENLLILKNIVEISKNVSQEFREIKNDFNSYGLNPEDKETKILFDLIFLLITKQIKRTSLPSPQYKYIQGLLQYGIQKCDQITHNVLNFDLTQKGRFVDDITAILILIKSYCWIISPFFKQIFEMLTNLNLKYELSLKPYILLLLESQADKLAQNSLDYIINHILNCLESFLMNQSKSLDDTGEVLVEIFLKYGYDKRRPQYVCRMIQLLKKRQKKYESISKATCICIKSSFFDPLNPQFQKMVYLLISLIVDDYKVLNVNILVELAKKYYQANYLNQELTKVAGKLQNIFQNEISMKNELQFIQYRIFKIQYQPSASQQQSILRKILEKLVNPIEMQQFEREIQFLMNYIHEFIKKNLNGIKKISWEKMSFIYDNMIISMKNILLEKSAIFDKIKKISIIAKNLYFILKNVFGIENDEYRDQNIYKTFQDLKNNCIFDSFHITKTCEYKDTRLFLFGISLLLKKIWGQLIPFQSSDRTKQNVYISYHQELSLLSSSNENKKYQKEIQTFLSIILIHAK